ncbi:MAG: ferrous iron transport protein A [Clostridia bacterium]|nr:ferrous iron transport protein A [Clostridia bacterium]
MNTIYDIPVGQTAVVADIREAGELRRRLFDLGFTTGARIRCVGESPLGNMKAFFVYGTVIALRKKECETIQIIRGNT